MIKLKVMTHVAAVVAILAMWIPLQSEAQENWQTPCEISTSGYSSGYYPNVFTQFGVATQAQVDARVQAAFNQLFVNGDTTNQRLLYDTSDGMSYIRAIDSNDIRSEGISYGMMIAVQMNQQTMFNRLWNFAVTHMLQRQNGTPHHFAWQLNASSPYSAIDSNPAPDGEEYMAMALIFAHNRWGSGTFSSTDQDYRNYRYWANELVRIIRNNLWDANAGMIVFSPNTSTKYTDPSYHIPVFYELFSVWANDSAPGSFWRKAAGDSRNLLRRAMQYHADPITSDYTHFDGSPVSTAESGTNNQHAANFAYDSWRVMQNIAMDYSWCTHDSHFGYYTVLQLDFFRNAGGTNARAYGGVYNPATRQWLNTDKSPGLVAMNATGLIFQAMYGASDPTDGFALDMWNLSTPTGTYRYYDGMLYMLGMLHVSGQYKIYKAGSAALKLQAGQTLDGAFASTTQVQPRITVKNNTGKVLTNFKANYYFTAEDGKTPVLTDVSTPNSTVSLQQLDTRLWTVVVDFTGRTLNPGQSVPASGQGETFSLRYSDNSVFDKSNDYSQPQNGTSYTPTDRIAVYDSSGIRVMGGVPDDRLPGYAASMKNTWSNRLLTASGSQDDADARAQPANPAWNSQTWQVEPVPGTGYVRLKNAWSGSYLNVQNQSENARIVTYSLNIPWTSQLWSVESVAGSQGVRLRNAWSGRYLTVVDTSDYSAVLSKSLNAGWASQVWTIQ